MLTLLNLTRLSLLMRYRSRKEILEAMQVAQSIEEMGEYFHVMKSLEDELKIIENKFNYQRPRPVEFIRPTGAPAKIIDEALQKLEAEMTIKKFEEFEEDERPDIEKIKERRSELLSMLSDRHLDKWQLDSIKESISLANKIINIIGLR